MKNSNSNLEVEKLARACHFILAEIAKLAGKDSTITAMERDVALQRDLANSRALISMLKELVQWSDTSPATLRDKVSKYLAAEGLSHFQQIDKRRIKRVLDRGSIRTASEYRSVQHYVADAPDDEIDADSLDKLHRMLVNFGIKQPQ